MGQMVWLLLILKRAALYFELFFERYPANAQANNLLKSAANMRELMVTTKSHQKIMKN